MKLYKKNKNSLEIKQIPMYKSITLLVIVLLIIGLLNAFIVKNIIKNNTIVTIIDTVYEESNYLDFRREFLFDKYKAKNKEAFYYSIRSSSAKLQIPHEWLLYMLYQESRFSPTAKNPKASATGIGQMTKGACKSAKVNYEIYKKANVYQQLLMVEKYLFLKKNGFSSYGELYLYLYLPEYVDKPNTFVIPQKYLTLNPGYAKFNTIGKFKAGVTSKFQKQLKKDNEYK